MPSASCAQLWIYYIVGWLTSVATVWLTVGIFFYTEHRFHFSLIQNLSLAAVQGILYVTGSLSANPLQHRLGRRRLLIIDYTLMALLAFLATQIQSAAPTIAALLAYSLVVGTTWPALESLIASGTDAIQMSRRLAGYNLVWSCAGAIAVACNGALIDHWLGGVLWLPAIIHTACVLLLLLIPSQRMVTSTQSAHLHAEEKLLAQRTLALWLSRLALPATYVVIYSLMAMLPSLPLIHRLSPTQAMLISSVWLGARFLAFALLAATAWWHSRPRLLLFAAMAMFIAFLGVILPAAEKVPGLSSNVANLQCLVVAQIVLGLAMGIIYSGSLYFGMVLSEGSTEHGGYHEALIGAGQVIGPGLGAVATLIYPNQPLATIAAVAAVLAASVLACAIATIAQKSHP